MGAGYHLKCNKRSSFSPYVGEGYSAGPGWDPTTGVGTPGDGSLLLTNYVNCLGNNNTVSQYVKVDPTTMGIVESKDGSQSTDHVVILDVYGVPNLESYHPTVTLNLMNNMNTGVPTQSYV